MGAADETTDPGERVAIAGASTGDPDLAARPVIEGDDPLAQGGWHSSGGAKATVLADSAPTTPLVRAAEAPRTVLAAEPAPREIDRRMSAEIVVTGAPGIAPGVVVFLVVIASAIAFVLGRWSG